MPNNNFFTITGGPGTGKTSLLNELKKRGYRCIEEEARQIIQEQMSIEGDAVPWKNLTLFKEILFHRTVETYKLAQENGKEITFFDRDILDLIGYDRHSKVESSNELKSTAQTLTYNKKAFIAPPWKEIYCTDSERKQTFEEAVEIYHNMVKVYLDYGREIIELPKTTVEKRADFVIDHIQS